MLDGSGIPQGQTVGYDVPIYAGGYNTSVDTLGSYVVRGNDVYGIGFADDTSPDFEDMIKANRLPLPFLDAAAGRGTVVSPTESGLGGYGGYAVRIAQTIPAGHTKPRVWALYDAQVMYKDDWRDPGRWIACPAFPVYESIPNGGIQRLFTHKMDVDPVNPDVMIVGYMGGATYYAGLNGGVYYTEDKGVTAHKVTGLDNFQTVVYEPYGSGFGVTRRAATIDNATSQFTLTVNAPSGAGSVVISGSTITVTPASGAFSPTAIVAQLNANGTFAASFDAWTTVIGAGASTAPTPGTTSSASDFGALLAFDPSSAVSGGKTQGVYAAIYGMGVYHSTTGVSGSFTLMAGSPRDACTLRVDSSGQVWVARDTYFGPNLVRYRAGAWSTVAVPPDGSGNNRQTGITGFCFDPANNNHMWAVWGGGEMIGTVNALAAVPTWFGPWYRGDSNWIVDNSENPWLSFAEPKGPQYPACCAFDTVNQRIYMTHGVGCHYVSAPTSFGPVTVTARTRGDRMIVAYRPLSIPGRPSPLFMGGDRMCFQITNLNVPPVAYGPVTALNEGMDIDYAGNNPDFVCVSVQNYGGLPSAKHAYSLSAGAPGTWTLFPVMPNGANNVGGMCACSTDQDMIYVGAVGGTPRRTKDRGATWTDVAFASTGTAMDPASGWCPAALYFARRHPIDADKTQTGVYYGYYNTGTVDANTGIWKIPATGNATLISQGALSFADNYFHGQMRCIPGHQGEMMWTAGDIGGENPAPSNWIFVKDNNDGTATRTVIAGFQEVKVFEFGKGLPGATYPTVYCAGWYNGGSGVVYTFGFWRIDHFREAGQTITEIADFANNHNDFITGMNADKNVYGRCFVAYQGSSFDRLELEDKRTLVLA